MTDYLEFQPAKLELCKKSPDDEVFIFYNNELLVKEKNLELVRRKELESWKLNLKYLDCFAAYNKKNYYMALLEEKYKPEGFDYISLRNYVNRVDDESYFYMASRAYMLLRHRFENAKCGVCGSDTEPIRHSEDRAMVCTSCGHKVWPSNSTAIIVAVTKGDKILLAHNTGFDEGRYSVLAGFVEMGESFEECVKREVREETGIRVKNIEYFGSQPWPFPNSMMVGFTAEYDCGEIQVDNKEISHADWFSVDQLPKVYRNSISIGSELIRWFINKNS